MRRWPRSFREANRRRLELIDRSMLVQEGQAWKLVLQPEDAEELELLDRMTSAWASYRWPIEFPADPCQYLNQALTGDGSEDR